MEMGLRGFIMSSLNAYEILGLTNSTTDEAIRSSYRKLALQYHPDKNRGDISSAEKFLHITAAYDKIKDSVHRKVYDESLLKDTVSKQNGNRTNTTTEKKSFDIADALREFMATIRSDTALRNAFDESAIDVCKGANCRITVGLSLRDVSLGVKKTIVVNHLKKCSFCNGTGSHDSTAVLVLCSTCNGHGMVRVAGKGETVSCPQCYGSGKKVQNACTSCNGSGRKSGSFNTVVEFPKGIGEGNFITVSGFGDAGLHGGKPGDLLVYVEDIPDLQFKRLGYDLETNVTIAALTAILGGQCLVISLEGETLSVQIPPGTQPESIFSIKDRGLPQSYGHGRGNLYVCIHIHIPDALSAIERSIYESLLVVSTSNKQPPLKSKETDTWIIRDEGEMVLINAGVGKFTQKIFERPEVAELISKKDVLVGLYLHDITIVDSMDIGFWIKFGRVLQKNGGAFYLVDPCESIEDIITTTSIDDLFPIKKSALH
jgi:molecular chaperone DnaJ